MGRGMEGEEQGNERGGEGRASDGARV